MDIMTVKDFLDEKCIHEENPELVLDWMDKPQYMNALKMHYKPPVNPNAGIGAGYGYNPNQGMMPPQGMNPGQGIGMMP